MPSILIVDDERSILSSISRDLSNNDYKIIVTETAIEALAILEDNEIDLIISDYKLSNTNGAEFLNLASRKWPYITRILLTGFYDNKIINEAINKAGVYKFITKPWDIDELEFIVSSAIKRTKIIKNNFKLIKEIENKNIEVEKTTKKIEESLLLKDKKILKSQEAVLLYQNKINAVNELLKKISAGKSIRHIVVGILESLKSVVDCNYSCIISFTKEYDVFTKYSEGSILSKNIYDYPEFVELLDTMGRNKYIPLVLNSNYISSANKELFFSKTSVDSTIVFPINISLAGNLYVFLICLGRVNKLFTRDDVIKLKEISGSIYVAIERLITTNYMQQGLQQWEETFNAINEPLFILSKDYRIIRANKAIERYIDNNISFILGKKCYSVFKKGKFVCDKCLVSKVLETGGQCTFDYVPCFSNSNIYGSAYPVLDQKSEISSVIQYNNDRTSEFGLYKQLIQSEKLAAIGLLASNIAHEINNPLGGILAYSQILISESEKESQLYSDLKEIESACNRCKKIIFNLLDFSRDSSQDTKKTFGLKTIIEDTLPLLNAVIKGQKLNIDIAESITVFGLQGQLQQVFFNLITNSAHATKTGGRINVCAKIIEESMVEIEISDNGCGIKEDILPHIFEPFFTTKEKGVGTGLGLFVVYGIIKEHGGSIEVESVVDTGTKFIIKLQRDG